MVRSSRPEVFWKDVLKNLTKFTEKRLRSAILLKKTVWHRCFPVDFPVDLEILFKGDSSTGVFLWMLWNFWETTFFIEHLFDCFRSNLATDVSAITDSAITPDIFYKLSVSEELSYFCLKRKYKYSLNILCIFKATCPW